MHSVWVELVQSWLYVGHLDKKKSEPEAFVECLVTVSFHKLCSFKLFQHLALCICRFWNIIEMVEKLTWSYTFVLNWAVATAAQRTRVQKSRRTRSVDVKCDTWHRRHWRPNGVISRSTPAFERSNTKANISEGPQGLDKKNKGGGALKKKSVLWQRESPTLAVC